MILWIRQLFCSHKWRRVGYGNLIDTHSGKTFGNYENHICDVCLYKKYVKWS